MYQESLLFLDHVEAVRMFTVSASSQACRPVGLVRIRCLFGPWLNNPPYLSGEPTTPLGLSGEPYFRQRQQGVLQGERDTYVIREAGPSAPGKEKRERHHTQRAVEGEGDEDGGIVRDVEGTLRSKTHQGEDEADRDTVHLLRHPHGECSSASPERSLRKGSGSLRFHA